MLVNTTTRSSYRNLGEGRGIGPNQKTPAFDRFSDEVRRFRPETRVLEADAILNGADAPTWAPEEVVIAVTENYPLPGMDFEQASQAQVVQRLLATVGERLIVVALRDPYELRQLGDIPTYLCAFSFRDCAARAAAEALLGKIPITGVSPVSC